MDKVQKYNSFNTNTPSSESYRNYLQIICQPLTRPSKTQTLLQYCLYIWNPTSIVNVLLEEMVY